MAFATSAVRDYGDVAEVLGQVREETGVELKVLTGEDEARLTFLAARRWLGWSAGRLLVVDVGGGSLELAVGMDGSPTARSRSRSAPPGHPRTIHERPTRPRRGRGDGRVAERRLPRWPGSSRNGASRTGSGTVEDVAAGCARLGRSGAHRQRARRSVECSPRAGLGRLSDVSSRMSATDLASGGSSFQPLASAPSLRLSWRRPPCRRFFTLLS